MPVFQGMGIVFHLRTLLSHELLVLPLIMFIPDQHKPLSNTFIFVPRLMEAPACGYIFIWNIGPLRSQEQDIPPLKCFGLATHIFFFSILAHRTEGSL